ARRPRRGGSAPWIEAGLMGRGSTEVGAAVHSFYRRARVAVLARIFPVLLRRDRSISVIRLGSEHGGWVPRDGLGPRSVCYCAGVGDDSSFDLALAETVGAGAVSLDPTPRAVAYVRHLIFPPKMTFLP